MDLFDIQAVVTDFVDHVKLLVLQLASYFGTSAARDKMDLDTEYSVL